MDGRSSEVLDGRSLKGSGRFYLERVATTFENDSLKTIVNDFENDFQRFSKSLKIVENRSTIKIVENRFTKSLKIVHDFFQSRFKIVHDFVSKFRFKIFQDFHFVSKFFTFFTFSKVV